ncbi:MAG: cyclodeaminase/cyclohydrolase family protein [Anaerolineae bacterium]|nr:cyclodeaminase/cyclohydrolase family protein [Anaerolineae bacterium]
MTYTYPLQPFLDELAAGTATPGGGSAAAIAGAMGAALVSMVCNLTIGKEKFAHIEAQMKTILARSEALRTELTQLINDDIEAFNTVMAAFRLPKTTDEQKAARRGAIQAATQKATLPPLATARACAQVVELCRVVAERGNPNAISDAGAGAACAQAGLKAAALNVLINLSSIKDETFIAARQAELDQILDTYNLADQVYKSVEQSIRGG